MILPIIIAIFLSWVITIKFIPKMIQKLREGNFVTKDMYKKGTPEVPTKGGIAVIFTSFLTLAIIPIIFHGLNKIHSDINVPGSLSQTDEAILLVFAMFALYGIVDDLINVGRPAKIILPLLFCYPLLVVVTPSHLTLPIFGEVDFSSGINIPAFGLLTLAMVTRYAIMPIYIMVVANLMNMHSGFNGLQSGLASILLIFIIIKSIIEDQTKDILVISAIAGAMIAFWWYNKYPAQIFEGNIGALSVGAAIGAVIVVQGFLISGFVMLLPHTVNFLLYGYWRLMHCLHPEDKRFKLCKFGKLRDDGTIKVPNRFTLKWIPPYYKRMSERQATYIMYALTIVFCTIGLFVPS